MPGEVGNLLYRWLLVTAVLLAGIAPAFGEPGYRMSLAFLKSFHPDSPRKHEYSTNHPSAGVGGPVTGEWLRWRAGAVRNSHSRWGPFVGLSGTFEIAEDWRAGLNAGIAGNYSRNSWVRVGALPIVQWKERESELIWEFGLAYHPDATFVGVGVHIPFSVLETR